MKRDVRKQLFDGMLDEGGKYTLWGAVESSIMDRAHSLGRRISVFEDDTSWSRIVMKAADGRTTVAKPKVLLKSHKECGM